MASDAGTVRPSESDKDRAGGRIRSTARPDDRARNGAWVANLVAERWGTGYYSRGGRGNGRTGQDGR